MRWPAVVIVVLLLAAGIAIGVLGAEEEAREKAKPKPEQTVAVLKPAPFKAGLPFAEPPVVRSRGDTLRTTITAQNGTVDVSGIRVAATQTYSAVGADGPTPRGLLGPTLHVKPGQWIELTLDNRLTVPDGVPAPNCAQGSGMDHSGDGGDQADAPSGGPQLTNLHFHGLHVTPHEKPPPYGDTVLVELGPGRHQYRFQIPPDHDKGTFWYHAHLHTCTDDQVFRGLAGMLLIGDSREDLPDRFADIRTRSFALKDIQVEQPKDAKGWRIPVDHDWGNPTHRTVNGLVNPKLDIRPGETQLWRLANVSSAVWYQVALVDPDDADTREPLTIVAQDGNSLGRPKRLTSQLIPPGRRYDVLVRGPQSGRRVLKTLPFNQGRLIFPEDTLATVEVGGAPAEQLGEPERLSEPTQVFPTKRGPTRRFTFDIYGPGIAFLINDGVFDPNIADATPRLNTTERWVIYNKSGEWHPFHIHQDDFRLIDEKSDGPPGLGGVQDIVPLPAGTPENPSKVEIDMPYTDFDGKFVFHCHILDHEDGGMMALVDLRKR